jgi:serpin B
VELYLPRFEYTADTALASELQKLGMKAPFEPGKADFSGMDGQKELFISDVLHKAFIKVNEKGTEAAAATAVIVGTTSAPPPPEPFHVDRPFVYLIRDLSTKAVLFVGRVVDPSAK